MIALDWRTLPGATGPKALVKGTELACAVVPETWHRFVLYEVRTLEPAPEGSANRYHLSVAYFLRDAATVSDAGLREGKRPAIVGPRFDNSDAAVEWAQALAAERA